MVMEKYWLPKIGRASCRGRMVWGGGVAECGEGRVGRTWACIAAEAQRRARHCDLGGGAEGWPP